MPLSNEPVFTIHDLPYACGRYNRFVDQLNALFPRIYWEPKIITKQESSVAWEARGYNATMRTFGPAIVLKGGTIKLFSDLAKEFQLVTYPYGVTQLYTRPLAE